MRRQTAAGAAIVKAAADIVKAAMGLYIAARIWHFRGNRSRRA